MDKLIKLENTTEPSAPNTTKNWALSLNIRGLRKEKRLANSTSIGDSDGGGDGGGGGDSDGGDGGGGGDGSGDGD